MVPQQAQQGPVEPARPGPGQAIEEARWLAPGVAYIRFTIFPFNPAVTAAAVKFMNDHADARTVIFDLRTHKGGGMTQTAAMLTYLFDKETVSPRVGRSGREYATLDEAGVLVPGRRPHSGEFRQAAPKRA